MNFETMTEDELREVLINLEPSNRAHALMELGRRLFVHDKGLEAEAAVSAAREIFANLGDDVGEAQSGLTEAQLLSERGEFDRAAKLFERVLIIWAASTNDVRVADAYFGLGIARCHLDDYQSAVTHLNLACDIYLELGLNSKASNCRLEVGEIFGSFGKQSRALKSFQDALKFARVDGNMPLVARSHDRVASALFDLGKAVLAVEHLREALALWRYSNCPSEEPYALSRLGEGLMMIREDEEAHQVLLQASELYKLQENFAAAASVDVGLVTLLHRNGNEKQALALLDQAQLVLRQIGKSQDILEAQLARLRFQTDEIAIEQYGTLIDKAEKLEEPWFASTARVTFALMLLERDRPGDVSRAKGVMADLKEITWGECKYNQARFLLAKGVTLIKESKKKEGLKILEKVEKLGEDPRFRQLRERAVFLSNHRFGR